MSLRQIYQQASSNFRLRLAYGDALLHLAVIGIVSGIVTGGAAVLFRLASELPLAVLLPEGESENFEGLETLQHFLFPVAGALILGVIWDNIRPRFRAVGVGHVIERLSQHQGKLPFGNAVAQFFGGCLALISGQSLGREGPAVQLGATLASLMGQKFRLPNNSMRTLVGCGIAAAIAASFNTPLAGVIFAMEVVLMEYTIVGFIPVMLAAVSGAVITQIVFGSEPAFSIPPLQLASLWELPWLMVCGIAIGVLAAAALRLYMATQRMSRNRSYTLRFSVAGCITGLVSVLVPQTLGVGYDTLQSAMLGELPVLLLLALVVTKLLSYAVSAGVGMPAGVIGPSLVIGACLGGSMGYAGQIFNPDEYINPGMYAILGMGAMMAATLNAPLAALIAVLELTYKPHVLLPAMLVIVFATITARMLSNLPGMFLIGRNPRHLASPVFQMLSRVGVTSQMDRRFAPHSRHITWERALELLDSKPEWLAIEDLGEPVYLMRPSDLAHFLKDSDTAEWELEQAIDLLDIPGTRLLAEPIHDRASLQEALILMKQREAEACYVTTAQLIPTQTRIQGVLTRLDIENYYL